MLLCPSKNTKEWKALEAKVGEIGAYQAWIANGFEIPAIETVVNSSPELTDVERPHQVVKIISNGTSGVSKIGLAVGSKLKLATGGVATASAVVDGYEMDRHNNDNIPETVRKNVTNSDATIVFGKHDSVAVKVAQEAAEAANKPFLVNPTAEDIKDFLKDNNISVLNISGDRDNKLTQNDIFQIGRTLEEALSLPVVETEADMTEPSIEILAIDETKTASQEVAVQRLTDVHNAIEKPSYAEGIEGSDRYKYEGKTLEMRVSELSKKRYPGMKEAPKSQENINTITGTKVHAVLENLVEALFNGKEYVAPKNDDGTQALSDGLTAILGRGAKEIVDEIKATQRKIDPNKDAKVMTELTVADPVKSIGGTLDLLVVYSDGSAAIFDWKTSSRFSKVKGKIVKGMDSAAVQGYNLQVSEYKRILKDQYGINSFRQSRLVPIDITYKTKETAAGRKERTNEIKSIAMGEASSKYLAQIPVAEEMTNRKELDEMLNRLIGVYKNIAAKEKETWDITSKEQLLHRADSLNKAISDIQLKHNVASTLKEISDFALNTRKNISINNPKDPLYVENILETSNTTKAYKEALKFALDYINKLDSVETRNKYKTAYQEATTALDHLDIVIEEKAKERLVYDSQNYNIEGILDPQKDVGFMSKWFKHLNDWEHPSLNLLDSYITKIQDDTRNRTRELSEKIEAELELLKKSKGSGTKVFNPLINEKTGNLVGKYSEEFTAKVREAAASGDVKWLKSVFEFTEEGKEKFKKDKAWKQDILKALNANKNDYNKKIALWNNRNNLAENSAWKNTKTIWKYAKLKDEAKHYSNEYRTIKADPALDRFYTFYRETMRDLMKTIPSGKRQSDTFIANIQKSTIDSLVQSKGRGAMSIAKSMVESLEVREDDNTFGMIDQATGKQKRTIPILYMTPLRDSEGKIDPSRKSFDLGRNLLLFANSVYNYKHASEMESKIATLREVVSTQKSLALDQSGNVIKNALGKTVKVLGENSALNVIDKYMDYYLYGHKLQGIDKKFEIKGKTYSSSKAIGKLISHYSLKTLSLNPISAFANLGGATSNAFMTGKKGKYYTNKQLRGAIIDITKRDKKSGAFAEFFDPYQDDMNFRRANDMSVNKLSKWLTVDNLMILQRSTDEFVDKSVAIAAGKNYGINPENGRVQRLSRLPKGTKSLLDLATIQDGKLKIEGLTEDGYNQFRSIVKHVTGNIKGTTSKESINLVQTTILGRVLMQFRSWLPQLVQERFRDPKYNNNVDEIELGRFRVAAGEILTKGFLPASKAFMKEFFVGGFGKSAYKLNQDATDERFNEFLKNNPSVLKKYNYDLASLKAVYEEERFGQMRAFAAELRMYSVLVLGLMAMAGDWDDDDEPDYKAYAATRAMYKALDRLSLELGFFVSPSEGIQLMNKPVAIMAYIGEVQNLIENTVTETSDFIIEDEDHIDKRDKTGIGYYTLKQFYGVNALSKFTRDVLKASNDDSF
jgi:hypothetical protein